MRKLLVVYALLLSVLLTISEAKATLLAVEGTGIPQTWSNPVTLDTETGLQWLNVFQIQVGGYNGYEELMNALSPGGQYYGWTLASAAQVLTLFDHAGLPSSAFGFTDTAGLYGDAARALQRLLGSCWTGMDDDWCYTWGIVSDSPGAGWLSYLGVETWMEMRLKPGGNPDLWNDDYYMEMLASSAGLKPISIETYEEWNFGPNPLGAWLIREQPEAIPTPEPSTVLLMAFGLFGFVIWGKTRSP